MNPYCSNQTSDAAAPTVQGSMTTPAEPTPIEQALVERQAGLVLKLAFEIFLQVPSVAAADAIQEGITAYHEAWVRGRKRVL